MIKLSFLEAIEIFKKAHIKDFCFNYHVLQVEKRKQLAPKKYEMLANFRKCPNPACRHCH